MRCSIVFRVTLRLLVINISSSSPAINTAPYYSSDVSQLGSGRWLWSTGDRVDNTWHVAALTAGSKAIYRLRIAISAYPTCIRCSRYGGFPSEYCYAVWHRKTRMVWLPDGEKIWWYVYSFWQNSRTLNGRCAIQIHVYFPTLHYYTDNVLAFPGNSWLNVVVGNFVTMFVAYKCSYYYPSYVSMEGYIGCCVFSLSGYRYLGDGGTDRCEFCMMVHIDPGHMFSPFKGGTPRRSLNPKIWA